MSKLEKCKFMRMDPRYFQFMESSDIFEHTKDVNEVAALYKCGINLENIERSQGLSLQQVLSNRLEFGSNKLPEPKKPSLLKAYFFYLQNLFSLMLVLCGMMSLSLYAVYPDEYSLMYVGIVLILVAFFNAFLEFYQKYKSEELLKGFMNLVPENAFVIRAGQLIQVPANDLVRGDLIYLRNGDKIAADARVITASDFKVDNSLLTGESEPVERDSNVSGAEQVVEARCIVFNGTIVASGSAYVIALRLGSDSAVGKLSKLTESSVASESQLSQEMNVAVNALVTAGLLIGITLMIVSFSQGFGLSVSFEIAIGTFLAFLPQGLPATITTLLTVAAKRMTKKNVLVKSLQGVETLGAITLLATDKTGTLTMNRMEAVVWWTRDEIESIEAESPPIDIVEIASSCSNIKVTIEADGQEKLIGDATEQGLFRMIRKTGLNISEQRRIFEIPFSSSSKWHLVVVENISSERFICMKGAPEKVLNYCIVDAALKAKFLGVYEEMGKRGLRVLAFARRKAQMGEVFTRENSQYSFSFDNLEFIGVVGLQDPPKPGTSDTISTLNKAGIQVVMITGDHPITATSIARQIGLLTQSEENTAILLDSSLSSSLPEASAYVVHGELIPHFQYTHWDRIMKADQVIFARTQPHHKLEIVTKFQEYGHIVAVSGDGANDSPALKKADLGISMNRSASDVSKEAADLILLDDNFNTIVDGVREGRLIFENLKKSIRYTLTHVFPEVSSLAVVAICGIPFPFPALLILVFDVFCEPGPAISFSTEPAPFDFMKLKPRKPARKSRLIEDSKSHSSALERVKRLYRVPVSGGEKLFSREMIFWCFLQGGIFLAVGCFGAYILTMILNDVPLSSLWRGVNTYFEASIGQNIQDLTLTNGTIATPDMQQDMLEQAQSAYFLALVFGQWFNLFLTKHRYKYPHGWDIFKNPYTYVGMFTSGAIACSVVFIPGIQEAFQTESIWALALAPPAVTGILLVAYEYPRRYYYFKYRHIKPVLK